MANENLKNWIGRLVYVAVILSLIYGIPAVMGYFLHSSYPMASITSGSMWPVLKEGDLVFIKGVRDKNEVKNGDIVVYKNYQGFTIHRVMAINDDTLVTKGDANNIFDPPINISEVVGKALSVREKPIRIPFVGEINIFIKYIKNKL